MLQTRVRRVYQHYQPNNDKAKQPFQFQLPGNMRKLWFSQWKDMSWDVWSGTATDARYLDMWSSSVGLAFLVVSR